MKKLVALLALLAGCDTSPRHYVPLKDTKPTGRFSVERVGRFEDTSAYYGERSIFLIRDTETEREFVGISGVGISELGSHSTGKHSTTQDER
jgi:hypothetical protein